MPSEDFEQLGHRVVRAAYPDARHTGNPDSGADTLLPRASGGWERAWQARRYSRGAIAWARCEDALDDAVVAYAVRHYTFVFARNLSHTQITTFEQRLRWRHDGVQVDYWDLSELLARLDESPEGRRAARSFFGAPQEEVDAAWREAVTLGTSELSTAKDVLGRLRALGAWLARRDDRFAYESHTWEGGQPQPSVTPGTVMSQVELDETAGRRIDARLRDLGREDVTMPRVNIHFAQGEAGRRAYEATQRATADHIPLRLTEGFTVSYEDLPDLWADEARLGTPDELRLEPIRPPLSSKRVVLRISTGRAPVVVDMVLQPSALEGWRSAWRGSVGGFEVDFAVRPSGDRGEGYLQARYELLDGASARQELIGVRATLGLQHGGRVAVEDAAHPDAAVEFELSERPTDDQLKALAHILECIVAIEDHTAQRLPVPSVIAPEEGRVIASAAELVRAKRFVGEIADEYIVPEDHELVAALARSDVVPQIQQDHGIEVFGRTLWLGHLVYPISDYEVSRQVSSGGSVVLRPRTPEARRVEGVLRHGRIEEASVPEGVRTLPAQRTMNDPIDTDAIQDR